MYMSPVPRESVARKLEFEAEWDAIFQRFPVLEGDITPRLALADCSVDTSKLFYIYFTDSGDLILRLLG